MPRTSKIKSSTTLQNKVNKLHKEGRGYQAISSELKKEGHTISFMAVKRYLDDVKAEKALILTQDNSLTEYVRERILDTAEQLRKANKLLWEMIESAQISKTFKLSVVKQIVGTVKLADELMRDFKGLSAKAAVTQSKVELIQIIINNLNDLERKGDIKILNPRLRQESTKAIIEEVVENGKSGSEENSRTEKGSGSDKE